MGKLRYASFALLSALMLASCVASPLPPPLPRPLPYRAPEISPLPTPKVFLSPVHKSYLALVLHDYSGPSGKKGLTLACGYDNMARMASELATLRVVWIWNWNPNPPLFAGIESVPNIENVADVGKPLAGNSQWLLGFNEPDGADQANMTPEAAARQWRRIEELYPQRKLASPQVLHHHLHWLERFRAAYIAQNGKPPRLDALAIHTYYGNTAADYISQVQSYIALARAWDVPEVWVTEFALAPILERSLRATTEELRTFVAWLEQEPMVTRYSAWTNRVECEAGRGYFRFDGPFDTPLVHMDGKLSELGTVYSGAHE